MKLKINQFEKTLTFNEKSNLSKLLKLVNYKQ